MNIEAFLRSLESGELRSAEKINDIWVSNAQVKQQILEVFKRSTIIPMPGGFLDKEPLLPREFSPSSHVRMVPGGTSVRPGTYIAKNVVIMPPSFINIGAFVDHGTMIDSHVLVGSCAQIGKNVHISAGVQIGGVLEPIQKTPVIIEDNCFIGAGAVLTEGIIVKQNAVIAPSLSLSQAVPIFDTIHNKVIYGTIPAYAVVVPGSRPLKTPWAKEQNLSINCGIIIKYRDEKTDAALILEDALRE